jgi:ATP synthase protein I
MVRAAFEGHGASFRFCNRFIRVSTTMVDTRGNDDDAKRGEDNPASEDAALSTRLKRLNQQLSKVSENRKAQADQAESQNESGQARASAMAVGLRLSSELVAGVLVGALLGWGLDHWLSTSPWGLIVFLLLGFAAGVMNVMRSAGVMAKQSERL